MYRPEGTRLQVYNEGLTAYLFDESNGEAVREAIAASRDEGTEPESLLRLAQSGALVAFELWQDDPIDIEVATGEPLSSAEKKPAKWMKTVRVPLALPSGRLRIETGSSLADPSENPPGAIELEPGDWELTLHRVDRPRMAGAKLEGYAGPDFVVTLRPWPKRKRPRVIAPVIYMGDAPRAPFLGRYSVDGGVFRGEVIGGADALSSRRLNINLDEPAFERLGLRRGLRLQLSAAGLDCAVLCQGRMIPAVAEMFLGRRGCRELAAPVPERLVGFMSSTGIPVEPRPTPAGSYRDYDYFAVCRADGEEEPAGPLMEGLLGLAPGTPVEVRVLGEPFFEVDGAIRDDWAVEEGQLRCRVVFGHESRVHLNASPAALRRLGFEDGDTLELEVHGERRKIFDRTYITGRDWIDVKARELRKPPGAQRARIAEIESRLYTADGRVDESIADREELQRERSRLAYHPDDLRRPPLVLGFQRSRDLAGWEMLELKSALWDSYLQPSEHHLDLAPGDTVVIRRLGRPSSP